MLECDAWIKAESQYSCRQSYGTIPLGIEAVLWILIKGDTRIKARTGNTPAYDLMVLFR